jgi:amino acid permease
MSLKDYNERSKLINQDDGDKAYVHHKGHGTIMGSVFNLTNGAIGTGILALPFAVSQCGLFLGPFLMLVFACLMSYTLVVICQTAMLHPQSRSYETLVRDALGKKASLVMGAAIAFQTFGSCTSYMIIIADSFTPILTMVVGNWQYGSYIANRIFAAAIISVVCIFPLALQKQMHHLRFSSTLSVTCVCYIVFVVVFRSAEGLQDLHEHTIMYINNQGTSILTAVPLIVFAFRSHTNLPPIYKELKDNHIISRAKTVVLLTMLICAFLYYITSIFGYLAFFGDTKDNILKNFPDDDILASIARGLLTFVMICHYPVVAYCCRSAIDYLIFGDRPLTNVRHISETLILWGCCFVTSILVPNITVVLGLAGSIPCTEFLFPSLFLRKFRSHHKWVGVRGIVGLCLSYLYATVTVIIAVACSGSIIYKNWIKH